VKIQLIKCHKSIGVLCQAAQQNAAAYVLIMGQR